MKRIEKTILKISLCLCLTSFLTGCGIVSILGTTSGSEEVIKAKFDITERYDDKILVLVNQPGWINPPVNLRREITNKLNAYMRTYFKKFPVQNIIDYETVAQMRNSDMDFDNRSVLELAEMFDAGLVLYVEISDFNLIRLTVDEHYSLEMKTSSVLYDGNSGQVLWPQTKGDSIVSLEIECERGIEQIVLKITTANAHCILRNFYDCPKHKYRVIEERRQFIIEQW